MLPCPLQVWENLIQSAVLRLPMSDARASAELRFKEAKAIVGEVMALMALNKVAHQVC